MVNKDKKAYTLTASYKNVSATESQIKNSIEKKQRTMVKVGSIDCNYNQGSKIYSDEGKSCSLSARGGGIGSTTGLYKVASVVDHRLNSEGKRDNKNITSEFNIRKLTPIECERLQSLPDNYTEGVAMTNRYKCLGNAFNADVIAHILMHI